MYMISSILLNSKPSIDTIQHLSSIFKSIILVTGSTVNFEIKQGANYGMGRN